MANAEGSKSDASTAVSNFEKLLGDLDTLAKGGKAEDSENDKKIEAAMEAGEADDKKGDPEDADDDEDIGGGKGKKKKLPPMKKGLRVTLESGEQVDAEDGTELIKSLTDQMGALGARVEASESTGTEMLKALGTAVELLKKQDTQIKGLSDKIEKLSGEGRGRRAVVSVIDKPTQGGDFAKGGKQEEGMKIHEFLAKAEAGFKAGKVSGPDLCFIESAINNGQYAAITSSLVNLVAQQ